MPNLLRFINQLFIYLFDDEVIQVIKKGSLISNNSIFPLLNFVSCYILASSHQLFIYLFIWMVTSFIEGKEIQPIIDTEMGIGDMTALSRI